MSISGLDPNSPSADGLAGLGDDEIRALKAALQACFPNLGGLIETSSGSGVGPTAAEFTALFDDIAALQGGSGTGLVTGEIRAWYGDIANLPSGWYVCDGTNGTPNLQGRMLIADNQTIGAQTGNPTYEGATTGGSVPGAATTDAGGAISADLSSVINDHTLVQNNIPSHEHYVAHDSFGSTENNGDAVAGRPINSHDGGGDAEYRLKKSASDSDDANVGKSSSWGASGAVDGVAHTGTLTVAAHTHTLTASLPSWHAVYYIMYTGA